MKNIIVFLISLLLSVSAMGRGTAEIVDGRLKIQFGVLNNRSAGAFQLRSILEQHGFKNKQGWVKTENVLAPLELYNYLYEDGLFVFTIFLPFDSNAFMAYDNKGFLYFQGEAAKKLFSVLKQHLPPRFTPLLEQYQWAEHNYCDKTLKEPAEYRCFINK